MVHTTIAFPFICTLLLLKFVAQKDLENLCKLIPLIPDQENLCKLIPLIPDQGLLDYDC